MHFPIKKLILLKYFTKNILRRFIIVLFILFYGAGIPDCADSADPAAITLSRQHISFDADWKFHLGHASDTAKDFNYSTTAIFSKTGKTGESAIAVNFNDSSWRSACSYRMTGRWNFLL